MGANVVPPLAHKEQFEDIIAAECLINAAFSWSPMKTIEQASAFASGVYLVCAWQNVRIQPADTMHEIDFVVDLREYEALAISRKLVKAESSWGTATVVVWLGLGL